MTAGATHSGLKFVADAVIPYAPEAFSGLGRVVTLPGNRIDRAAARDADILLVRSWTRIDGELLEGSRVKFVASAVTGTDHVDFDYLNSAGIGFAGAAGSNANSVAEYVIAALLELAVGRGFELAGKSIGIIGVGNVGSRVSKKAEALGMTPLWNDPPLARQTGDARYLPLNKVVGADIVTFHVPLTPSGPDRTLKMADADFFAKLKPGTVLINSSRGPVLDEPAFLAAKEAERFGSVVMDVWNGEPDVNPRAVAAADIATPHIAGHSFDAKVNGTVMIYRAVCEYLGIEPAWDPAPLLPPTERPSLDVEAGDDDEAALRRAVAAVYDIAADDAALREMIAKAEGAIGPGFLELRKKYHIRREFHNTAVRTSSPELARKLAGIGFRVD